MLLAVKGVMKSLHVLSNSSERATVVDASKMIGKILQKGNQNSQYNEYPMTMMTTETKKTQTAFLSTD